MTTQTSEIPSLLNSEWPNRKARLNRPTNNGDDVPLSVSDTLSEILIKTIYQVKSNQQDS